MNSSSSFACWAGPGLVSWSTYLWFLRTDLDSPKRSQLCDQAISGEPALGWSWDRVWTALEGKQSQRHPTLKHCSCQLCCKSTVSLSLFVSNLSFICAAALELSLATQICVCVCCSYYHWQILTLFKIELRLVTWLSHGFIHWPLHPAQTNKTAML